MYLGCCKNIRHNAQHGDSMINWSLEDEGTKGFIAGAAISVVTSVVAMYIFYRYIAEEAATTAVEKYSRRYGFASSTQRGVKKMSPEYKQPSLMLEISTCEYYDDRWNLVLTHTFYGDTGDEINQLIEAHRKTDTFFDASFTGEFNGIRLKNYESEIVPIY